MAVDYKEFQKHARERRKQVMKKGGGGGLGGMPRTWPRIHLPRFTGEVRVGLDVRVRTLA